MIITYSVSSTFQIFKSFWYRHLGKGQTMAPYRGELNEDFGCFGHIWTLGKSNIIITNISQQLFTGSTVLHLFVKCDGDWNWLWLFGLSLNFRPTDLSPEVIQKFSVQQLYDHMGHAFACQVWKKDMHVESDKVWIFRIPHEKCSFVTSSNDFTTFYTSQ